MTIGFFDNDNIIVKDYGDKLEFFNGNKWHYLNKEIIKAKINFKYNYRNIINDLIGLYIDDKEELKRFNEFIRGRLYE